LPRRLPAAPAVLPAPESQRPVAVVLEDHEPTNKLLCDWLADAGLDPVAAYDGPSGLERARNAAPQLVVLDIRLPGIDGWQVVTELRSEPRTAAVPVVIVTMTEDRKPATDLKIQEFFVKPVDRALFLDRLRQLLPDLFGRQPIRVLVVDADPSARAWVCQHLTTEQTAVIEAGDARICLEILLRELPDVLVLDALSVESDGFNLVAAIRQRHDWDGLPILIVTDRALPEDVRRRLNGHIQALVSKDQLTRDKFRQRLADLGLSRR
jgi:DNA-binding response OmpR family regulator